MERDLAGVRLAEGRAHLDTTGRSHSRKLSHETAFTNSRRPYHTDHSAVAVDRTVQQALDGGQLPPSADQGRLRTPDGAMLVPHAQQASGRDPFIGTLDLKQLRFAESRSTINQSRCGRAEHHPARR